MIKSIFVPLYTVKQIICDVHIAGVSKFDMLIIRILENTNDG